MQWIQSASSWDSPADDAAIEVLQIYCNNYYSISDNSNNPVMP